MKKRIFFIFLTSFFILSSQEIESVKLPDKLKETSGLEYLNKDFITINDKGNDPIVYRFDTSGGILSEIIIKGKNIDWEDLASDNNGNLYIADTGNNNYSRRKLKILIVRTTSNYFNVIGSMILKINKEDKVNIEAITVVGTKLHLFNKNDSLTSVYEIPIHKGTYSLNDYKTQTLKTNVFITGADYDIITDTMLLSGYDLNKNSFINVVRNYRSVQKIYSLTLLKNIKQIEGIKLVGDYIYFTNEKTKSGSAKLNRIPFHQIVNHKSNN